MDNVLQFPTEQRQSDVLFERMDNGEHPTYTYEVYEQEFYKTRKKNKRNSWIFLTGFISVFSILFVVSIALVSFLIMGGSILLMFAVVRFMPLYKLTDHGFILGDEDFYFPRYEEWAALEVAKENAYYESHRFPTAKNKKLI